jgi:hypothetical protein
VDHALKQSMPNQPTVIVILPISLLSMMIEIS